MSYNLVNPTTGDLTRVAGLSGELVPSVALYQKGRVTATNITAGGYAIKDISFANTMPNTDYIVVINNASNGYLSVDVVNKTTSGFTAFIYNRAISDIDTGAFDWQAFKLMTDEVHEADASAIAQNTANFAPTFSETTSYAVGDYVTYNNILYRCTTAHTAGVWVAGHFTQVTVGSQLKVQDISSSITMEDGYDRGQIHVFRDGNTVQVLFNSVMTTGYSKTICSGLPRPLHISYFCVQADGVPQELGLGSLLENGSLVTGAETAGMGPSKVWDGFITYLTRD